MCSRCAEKREVCFKNLFEAHWHNSLQHVYFASTFAVATRAHRTLLLKLFSTVETKLVLLQLKYWKYFWSKLSLAHISVACGKKHSAKKFKWKCFNSFCICLNYIRNMNNMSHWHAIYEFIFLFPPQKYKSIDWNLTLKLFYAKKAELSTVQTTKFACQIQNPSFNHCDKWWIGSIMLEY